MTAPFTGVPGYEYSPSGRPICGQSFMADTICTADRGHDDFHQAYCEDCGGDWMTPVGEPYNFYKPCTCPTSK